MRLTPKAVRVVDRLAAEWRATEAAVAEIEAEIPYPLSRVGTDIEQALRRKNLPRNWRRTTHDETRPDRCRAVTHVAAVPEALVGVQSCFGAVSGPASRTFVARLLPEGQVAAGLAVNRIAFQVSLLFGPAAGGLAVGWLGVGDVT